GQSFDLSEIYDADAGAWSDAGAFYFPRREHAASLVPGGKVVVTGGFNGSTDVTTLEIWDPAARTWNYNAALVVRANHVSSVLPRSGKLLLSGGVNSGFVSGDAVELGGPAAPIGAPRAWHTA